LVVLGGAAISNALAVGVDSPAITDYNKAKIGDGSVNVVGGVTNIANIEDAYVY
jgi:hypothetical protein